MFLLLSVWAVLTPFLMNTAGWLLTESGRQPWIVQGLQKTVERQFAVGEQPPRSGSAWIVFVLAYIVLGAADLVLMLRYSRRGLAHADAEAAEPDAARRPAPSPPSPTDRCSFTRSGSSSSSIFWIGFFVLEGFDFGVGALHMLIGRTETERRVVINTIGPWWDGNEVWLIVAGASMFAAFPGWYATMFSALYLALVLVLVRRCSRVGSRSSTGASARASAGATGGRGR